MSESYIGWWAHRVGQKAHLVESEVTHRLVMRCGRQMALEARGGYLVFEVQPTVEGCEQCQGRIVRNR